MLELKQEDVTYAEQQMNLLADCSTTVELLQKFNDLEWFSRLKIAHPDFANLIFNDLTNAQSQSLICEDCKDKDQIAQNNSQLRLACCVLAVFFGSIDHALQSDILPVDRKDVQRYAEDTTLYAKKCEDLPDKLENLSLPILTFYKNVLKIAEEKHFHKIKVLAPGYAILLFDALDRLEPLDSELIN